MVNQGELEVIIGLEVHIQLTKLRTKLFCGCTSNYRGKPPNTTTCEVCLALPGTLPVLNKSAVDYAILLGLALDSKVQGETFFFRKNYFYPDMAKNFQITQYDKAGGVPICVGGELLFSTKTGERKIRFSRLHLEEDPGRLSYDGSIVSSPHALVDYNRHGCTLIEAVTEPDMRSPEEARAFLKKLRSIVEHLGIADLSLDGSMRCDANISFKGYQRVEIKNISSVKEVERALKFEMMRQKQKIKAGGKIVMETRHWDETRRVTMSLRTKETEKDYRYFPEPDLVPLKIGKEYIEEIRDSLPELPDARRTRFVEEYGIPEYDATVIVSSKAMADFFEETCKIHHDPKNVSNWLMGDISRRLNELNVDIEETKLDANVLAGMLDLIKEGTISGKIAKKWIKGLLNGESVTSLLKKFGSKITDEAELLPIITDVIAQHPDTVQEVIDGDNPRTIEFLIGQVMRKTKGQADPEITRTLMEEEIKKA
ncbi:Asp-tRNA(Asn)/Glu-tRNA(Gln) amidotransferase subunit GatB [Candidatus Bathyarchaeota archaeon]|nr:Asp-tRNA(Asn)/Glu-tRNA(Gln) amidotransferase subunit GatB [Candidatus Bathyarchaeota archaeon]